MTPIVPKMPADYLGDGCYVEYDGYSIILKTNSRTSPTDTIYLDPLVIAGLQRFLAEHVYLNLGKDTEKNDDQPTQPA